MGKVVGLVGAASGKIGNIVYAVTNGIQTARVYQPVVSNPKTQLQIGQRAKANLIGRLSGKIDWQVIVGLNGASKRSRRSRFLQLGLRAADLLVEGNSTKATIKSDEIIFSEGSVMPVIGATNYSAQVRSVSLTLSKLSGASDDDFDKSGVIVVVLLSSVDQKYVSALYRVVTADEFTHGSINVIIPHIEEGSYLADFYICPFATADGAKMTTVTSKLIGENDDGTTLSAVLAVNPAAVPMVWGDSKWLYQAQYTAQA